MLPGANSIYIYHKKRREINDVSCKFESPQTCFFLTGVFPDGDMPVSDQVLVDLEAGESVLENHM